MTRGSSTSCLVRGGLISACAVFAGCFSIRNLVTGPQFYGGTRIDVLCISDPHGDDETAACYYDLPFSAVLDTALLPITILAELCRWSTGWPQTDPWLDGRSYPSSEVLRASSAGFRAPAGTADPMEWTVGSWHGVRRSGDDGHEAPMTVRVEPLLDEVGQVESLRVEVATGPYVGFTVRFRDQSGAWRMVYANSTQRQFARLEGNVEATRSVWTSVTPGRTRESRLVSERLDANTWRKTQQVSEDGGATWKVLFTDELMRDAAR